jgi:hypothetical protein
VRRNVIVLGLSGLLCLCVVAKTAGQQRANSPAAPATMDDVLQELRALRAELKESATASVRAQLLVARLQLQEQRINTVWRQLSEIEGKLQANQKNRAAPEEMLKLMGFGPGAEPPKELNPIIELWKNQAAVVEQTEADLKLRQAELMQLMTQEQSRWTTFNAQLEALEKALRVPAPRR